MTPRENMLRAVRFETPDYIPMQFHINGACWHRYPVEALRELMVGHPLLFPDAEHHVAATVPQFTANDKAGVPFADDWGCVWETTEDGIVGTVTKHPLADWEAFDGYVPPDPMTSTGLGPMDWDRAAASMAGVGAGFGISAPLKSRNTDPLRWGGLQHGHTFLRLCDLRGYQNLLYDMVDDDPRLHRLIEMVESFNAAVVAKYLEIGAEWMSYAEDLGMQVGPMLSPDLFRKFIKPSYQRLMKPARDKGCVVHMHSDGDIRELAADLVDGGVEVLNLQDLVNSIDWIKDNFTGKTCIELDIDRQSITPYGTPQQIDDLIREAVTKLSTKQGGLMMVYGLYPGVPLENVKALMDAMERYAGWWA